MRCCNDHSLYLEYNLKSSALGTLVVISIFIESLRGTYLGVPAPKALRQSLLVFWPSPPILLHLPHDKVSTVNQIALRDRDTHKLVVFVTRSSNMNTELWTCYKAERCKIFLSICSETLKWQVTLSKANTIET